LHAICHLERVDARRNFRIADNIETLLIEPLERIERIALHFAVDALRIGKIENRLA